MYQQVWQTLEKYAITFDYITMDCVQHKPICIPRYEIQCTMHNSDLFMIVMFSWCSYVKQSKKFVLVDFQERAVREDYS